MVGDHTADQIVQQPRVGFYGLHGSRHVTALLYIQYILEREVPMLTRVFKSGNSLAVRIPKDLAFIGSSENIEIERVGNTLVLRPVVQQNLTDLEAVFASFPEGFMAQGREFHEQKPRDWSEVS